jgi:nucleotide sugar dehydrogenase
MNFKQIGRGERMFGKFGNVDNKSIKVCVIGLGNVGRPVACLAHECNFDVCGYDIDKRKKLGLNPVSTFSVWSEVPDCNFYIVCVNTGWEDGKPDMSNVFDACRKIAMKKRGNKPLVSIESTVAVGTCREVAEKFDQVHLVHVPHRFWAEEPEKHGVKQQRIIGSLNPESLDKAKTFYESLGIPLYPVSSLEVAELTKITENAYRFVQIAFVEQLQLLCGKNNVPFQEVRKSANTKWNVNLLEARDGVKGECLPKDIRYFASLGAAPLLLGAIEADKKYVEYLKFCKKYGASSG